MKLYIYGIVTLLASCIAFTATTAHAQNSKSLRAHIPFVFTVGKTTLPAGDYLIGSHSSANNILQLRSVDSSTNITVLPLSVQDQKAGNMQLVFHGYGEARFLSQIWTPDYQFKLSKSRTECESRRRIARHADGETMARTTTPEIIIIQLVATSDIDATGIAVGVIRSVKEFAAELESESKKRFILSREDRGRTAKVKVSTVSCAMSV